MSIEARASSQLSSHVGMQERLPAIRHSVDASKTKSLAINKFNTIESNVNQKRNAQRQDAGARTIEDSYKLFGFTD